MKRTLCTLPSGPISIDRGADGVFLTFDCACRHAVRFCHAACCCLPAIVVTPTEAKDPHLAPYLDEAVDATLVMKRRADGWCLANDPPTGKCRIYAYRPSTCRHFHCSKGDGMRGFRLRLCRQSEQ